MLVCCTGCCFGITLLIFILSAIATWIVVPIVLEDQITKNVILEESNEIYKAWTQGSYPIENRFYMFNVKNPIETANGAVPILEQVGPYVFRQLKQKQNVVKNEAILNYNERRVYEFRQNDSLPNKLDDTITVLNAPLFAVISWFEANHPELLPQISDSILSIFPEGQGVTLTTTVGQLLMTGVRVCDFGAPPSICNFITADNFNMITNNRFSFYNNKYPTMTESFGVNSGLNNPKDMGKVVTWNSRNKMTQWKEEGGTCNDVRGSDGIIFPPYVDKGKIVEIFKSDYCRSFPFRFNQRVQDSGLSYMFSSKSDAFPAPVGDAKCYCLGVTRGNIQDDGCVKRGAMEMHTCLGSHVVLSSPHFYLADESYQMGVTGLSPSEELHDSNIVLDFYFGFLMRSHLKVQYNQFARQVQGIVATEKLLSPVLFPIFWVHESTQVATSLITELGDMFYDIINLFDLVSILVVSISGALALLALVTLVAILCLRGK